MTRLDHGTARPAGPLRLLAVAVGLLTRLPVRVAVAAADLPRATAAMPAVGALVAAAMVAVRAAGEPLIGAGAASGAAVLSAVAVTGGLHEDGLADAADGLWGAGEPARRLAIMRDSHLGAYGVIALAGALGLQAAILAPLSLPAFAAAVLAAHVLGRGVVPALARAVGSADGHGLGASVAGGPGGWGWLAVAVTVTAAAVAATAVVAVWWWAPVPLAVAGASGAAAGGLLRRRVGGVNGDGYGAAIVATQTTVLAAVAALARLAG